MHHWRLFGGWLCLCLCGLLAWNPSQALAAQANAPDPQVLYDCEAKAAEYTKNLGRPGDKTLYQEHLKLCLEVLQAKALPRATNAVCAAGLRPMIFKNNTSETIWVGVWDSNKGIVVPPSDWPNWELTPNASKTWCAPNDFQGRFTARARCNVATGQCLEGNCCGEATCGQMVCTTTSKPASLAEINFDVAETKRAWYDTSYVDGYNFLVTFTPNNKECQTVGTGKLPDCPWKTVNGVCLAPYRQYEVDHPWHEFEPDYYVLAAMCAQPKVCGCGNQCPDVPADPKKNKPVEKGLPPCPDTFTVQHPVTKLDVTLASSGCSPIATYSDPRAKAQVVCDPLKADYSDGCKHPWPQDYKVYVQNLHQTQPSSYSWQYKDKESLATCALSDDLAFTITFGPRPANPKGNANVVTFSPGDGLTGTIKVGAAGPVAYVGPTPVNLPVADGSKLVIDRQCADSDTHLSCEVSLANGKLSISDSNVNCSNSNGNLAIRTPNLISFGMPDKGACVNKNSKLSTFRIYAGTDVTGIVYVDKRTPLDLVGGKDFSVDLQDGASVVTVLKCDKGTLTCRSTFNATTGYLDPEAGQDKCWTMGWKIEKLTLHPAKPAADQCK